MDGDTSGVEQNVLFGAMAKDSELQFEFQQAVSIYKGFSADKVVLTPPASLTNSLFVSAGFKPPMPSAAAAKIGLISKFRYYTTPVLSAAVGALVTAFVFLGINSSDNTGLQNNNSSTSVTNHHELSEISASVIPFVRSSEAKNISSSNSNMIKNEEQTIAPMQECSRVFSSAENSFSLTPGVNFTQHNNDYSMLYKNDNIASFSLPEFNIMNLEIEVRGMTGLAFLPSRTIQPEPFSIMNNMGIGIKYKFNQTHSAGIVAGKESLQMYSFNKIGESYQYNHEPNLSWIGACYRWTGDEFYGTLNPYTEFTGAYSQFGPVGKATFGIAYNPENIISMSLGIEGTMLTYKFLGDLKTTEKISVVYSIGLHF